MLSLVSNKFLGMRNITLGTIQILRKHWTGWMGSEIGHFCLLTVHREWVGGFKIISKNMHTYSPDRQ